MRSFRTLFQIEISFGTAVIREADVSPTEALQKFLKLIQDRRLTLSEIESARVDIMEQDTETWRKEAW